VTGLDIRWIYWEPETKLLDEKRHELFPEVGVAAYFVEARQRQRMERFDRGYVTRSLPGQFRQRPVELFSPEGSKPKSDPRG
jgi:hypothetical protein